MKNLLKAGLVILLTLLSTAVASAQMDLLKKAAGAAKNKVTNSIEKRVEKEADKAVDKTVNNTLDKIFGKGSADAVSGQAGTAANSSAASSSAAGSRTAASFTAVPATAAQLTAPVDPKTDEWPEYKDTGLGLSGAGTKTAGGKGKAAPSYSAYRFEDGEYAGKVWYNADRKLYYELDYDSGSQTRRKTIIDLDSLFLYVIHDDTRTVDKIRMEYLALLSERPLGMLFGSYADISYEASQVSQRCGRWCYPAGNDITYLTDENGKDAGEYLSGIVFNDIATGIPIVSYENNAPSELRNIHTGLQHPEVFDLPAGYRVKEIDPMEKMQKAADALESFFNKRQ